MWGHVAVVGFCVDGTLAMMLTARHDTTRHGTARHRLSAAVIYYGFPERSPVTERAPYVVRDLLIISTRSRSFRFPCSASGATGRNASRSILSQRVELG